MISFPEWRVKPHTVCRACDHTPLVPYLDLGVQALANGFLERPDQPEFTAPLGLQWCSACGLSQLTHTVNPSLLYDQYPYASGANPAWRAHEQTLVHELTESLGPRRVLEIASNDGTLLGLLARAGHTVLGVDPAASGPPAIKAPWNSATAKQVLGQLGPVDVVIAQNVVGHVDDVQDFFRQVHRVLGPKGLCIVECPHILAMLDQTAFDTVYHEHLSVWGATPLLTAATGFSLTHTEYFPELHGGTMRYYLRPGSWASDFAARETLETEARVFAAGITPYRDFADRVQTRLAQFAHLVAVERKRGRSVWGLGAAAKGNVLLQASGVILDAVADDAPLKQRLFTPGTHLPVFPIADLGQVDVLVVLAWNWADQLMSRATAAGFGGTFLVPFPEPHVR